MLSQSIFVPRLCFFNKKSLSSSSLSFLDLPILDGTTEAAAPATVQLDGIKARKREEERKPETGLSVLSARALFVTAAAAEHK